MKNNLLLCTLLAHTGLVLCAASSSSSDALGGLTQQLTATCTVSDINERTGQDGSTQLMRAAFLGNSILVRKLLLQKADPYIKSTALGATALMGAAQEGHTDVVLNLLALSHDKKKLVSATVTSMNMTAIDLAKKCNRQEIVEILTHVQNEIEFGPLCETYFSPNIFDAVLNCINNEQKSIHCAMYHFTLGDPARAIVARKNAGVAVNLIIDKDYKYDPRQKAFDQNTKANICIALRHMINNGIEIRECNMGSNHETNNGYFNMHNKYLVFGCNKNDKPLLITGSYNFTHQATTQNWENIVLLDDQKTIDTFLAQHELMKKHSVVLPLERCKSDKDNDYYAKKNNGVDGLA